MKIAILMSTYNGARFLCDQIESIINQSYSDWNLYIRDDGSNDNTLEIIKEFCNKDSRIIFLEDNINLGAARSFMKLVSSVESDYYMFCDQDDVWLKDKVQLSFEKISENDIDSQPVLVFSDSKVVNTNLEVISDSFWDYNKSFPRYILDNPEFINVFNCAPGCTMIFNKELRNILYDYDSKIIMHDWFVIIKSLKYGKVDFIDRPLMLYRQHFNNVIGADKVSILKNIGKLTQAIQTIKNQLYVYQFVSNYTQISLFKFYKLKLKFNILRFKE